MDAIYAKTRKSNAGAPAFDAILMLKILILQQLNNLSDDKMEYMIRDRLSFQRFLAIEPGERIPDAKTIWVFKDAVRKLNLHDALFAEFNHQLDCLGYSAKGGQLVDSTFVEAPRQRNSREDNATIKAGEIPEAWLTDAKKPMLRQKDRDATWTKKNGESYYGYKNHINADQEFKLIRSFEVSTASVHDSNIFYDLLDQTDQNTLAEQEEGLPPNKRAAYADSAYRSVACEKQLEAAHIPSQVHERAYKDKPLTEEQKALNKEKSRVRVRVEHVFGSQALMGMHFIRSIGIERARIGISLCNLTYNMVRYLQLEVIKLNKKETEIPATG